MYSNKGVIQNGNTIETMHPYISGWPLAAVLAACRLLTHSPLIHNEPHLHYHQHPSCVQPLM